MIEQIEAVLARHDADPDYEPRFVAAEVAEAVRSAPSYRDDAHPDDELYWATADLEALALDPTLTDGELERALGRLRAAISGWMPAAA